MFSWLLTTFAMAVSAGPAPELRAADLPAITSTFELALEGGSAGEDAIKRLRAGGPEVFDVLVRLLRERSATNDKARWEAVLDQVARQRHAWASGLFWFTDLDAAKARAQKEHKPIVSLRLLGDLDELLSCANSRFFRALLYPDPAIAQALHDGFILHWESVRKAPRIRIDFGNGKVLERTVTGNSLHFMLDWNGHAVDAFPGLASAAAFKAWLDEVGPAARAVGVLAGTARTDHLTALHEGWLGRRVHRWATALNALGVKVFPLSEYVPGIATVKRLAALTTEAVLARMALSKAATFKGFDAAVREVIARDLGRPSARMAAPLAVSKMAIERPMLPFVDNVTDGLGKTLMKDEVQNDLVLHAKIHAIFLKLLEAREADRGRPVPLAEMTSTIYADAFLTPLDDPFMGLAPPDVFTAIPPSIEKTAYGAIP
jgi:hypothetical protein